MNPTNESIGRAFDDVAYSDDDLRTIVQDWDESDPIQKTAMDLALKVLRLREAYRARELDRQATGDAVRDAIAGRPIYLMGREHVNDGSKPLAELVYGMTVPTSGVLFCMKDTEAAIPAPQPPAQEQGEKLPVVADYTPVSPDEEAEIDAALGLVKVRMRVPADLHRELVAESKARGMALAAVIRERLTRAAGAEDAREAGAMMERWQSVWEDCNEIACNTGSDMIHRRAMQVLSYLDDHEPGKLERDAARYRFLRDVADNKDRVPFIAKRDSWCVSAWNGEAADESIDAAIASQAKEGEK